MLINSKLPNTEESIFSVMSAKALEYNAINLSQGFPDFEMSSQLIQLVNKAMVDGYNQYSPMAGSLLLREQIAAKTEKLYAVKLNTADEITITAGATNAIYNAITCCLQKGDEAIIFEPAYDCYIPAIELCGAVPIPIRLQYPTYQINWQEVSSKINTKTKLIIINNPNNPTGKIFSKTDLEQLEKIVANTNIVVISDEVYEHLVYDGLEHETILKYPKLFERSFVTYSFGKPFHCTGWKLGYCIAPKDLMQEFRKVHQFNCFSVNTPMQIGIANFLKNEENYNQLSSFYQQKRNHFLSLTSDVNIEWLTAEGTYFLLGYYGNLSQLPDKEFALKLTKEIGVATIPISSFYSNGQDDKVLRFCFAKNNNTLQQAAERLLKLGIA